MNKIYLNAELNTFELLKPFNISRNSKTHVQTIHLTMTDEHGNKGISECVPYERYNESITKTLEELNTIKNFETKNFNEIYNSLKYKSSQNAFDSCFIDYTCKKNNIRVWNKFNITPKNILTSYTISLNSPEQMAHDCQKNSNFEILKLKFSDENDIDRIAKIREKLPKKRIIIDVNEGWNKNNFSHIINEISKFDIEMIEQPLKAEDDDVLIDFVSPIKLCADESFHSIDDIQNCKQKYSAVNVKLDKIGGITNAINCIKTAKKNGLNTMIGCMMSSSMSMAQAYVPALLSDYCDLDGSLWLKQDIQEKLIVDEKGYIKPYSTKTWG